MKILVIDDTDANRLARPFLSFEHEVKCIVDLEGAEDQLHSWWPDIVILDAIFPKNARSRPVFSAGAFLDVLDEINRGRLSQLPEVILVSGQDAAARKFGEVVNWLEKGRIADVLPKSTADLGWEFFEAVLQHHVARLCSLRQWRSSQQYLEDDAKWFRGFGIITKSPNMLTLRHLIVAASKSDAGVLIQGASGTGKELVARAIHALYRAERPIEASDCGAIPVYLFESEMFGQLKGSSTDICRDQLGRFELAGNGTLFLDQVENLPLVHQVKFLRALQERQFRPIGATKDRTFKARVIAASSTNLAAMVAAGTFRSDLYYRLSVLEISIPPLAERIDDDIPLLVDEFLSELVSKKRLAGLSCPSIRLSPACIDVLQKYRWPGNVRELQSFMTRVVEKATVNCHSDRVEISLQELRQICPSLQGVDSRPSPVAADPSLLGLEGDGIRIWADLSEQHIDAIRSWVSGRLTASGRDVLGKMVSFLKGRETGDPSEIHFWKALLFLILVPSHSARTPKLVSVLGLEWAQTDKVAKSLLTKKFPDSDPIGLVELYKEGGNVYRLCAGVL